MKNRVTIPSPVQDVSIELNTGHIGVSTHEAARQTAFVPVYGS